jgi:hypothetical protein
MGEGAPQRGKTAVVGGPPRRGEAPYRQFVVLPAAVRFFVNFNSSEFNVLVQASQYYKFAAVTLLAMGLVFQVPVGILAATRARIAAAKAVSKDWNSFVFIACSKHFPSASSGTTYFDFRKGEEEFSRALPSFLHRLRRETIWRSLPDYWK